MEKIGKTLLNYLIKGLLVVVPIAVSIYIVVTAVATIDSWLNVNNILGINPQTGENRNIPGLGLFLVIAIIMLAGVFVTNFVTEPMYNWFRKILKRLPFLNFIFSSVKDLTEAFVGDEKKFNNPVLVEVEPNIKRIGFLTQNNLTKLNLPDEVIVYFPLSYSFAGQVCIIKKDKVVPLDMNASDAMKLVLSGGVSQF